MSLIDLNNHVLVISASTASCTVVLDTPKQRYEWQSQDSNQHSEQLLPAIQHLLAQAGLVKLNQTDFIAVDIGPGSFTSVRVACAIAQGLAFGWGCQVIPVESLTALAYQSVHNHQFNTACAIKIMAVIDARMSECYVAQYFYDINGTIKQIVEPTLVPYAFELLPIYQQSSVLIGNKIELLSNTNKLLIQANPLAVGVLLAAKQFIIEGQVSNTLDSLQPLYVRNQVALTTAERALNK